MSEIFEALKRLEKEKQEAPERDSPGIRSEDRVLDSKLVSLFEPSSMVAEQFRRLRTYIIKAGRGDAQKTILVTSALAGEGKSLVAINLAITIAVELHSNALLVDCDLRNPSISRLFGFQEKKGLSDYLLGEAEIPDLLIKTPVDKLSILPGGTLQDNPVELIGSKKMKSLVDDLKTRYDDRYIILDSSPILATTEPSVLNDMVDGILLVIKSGDTPRESVQFALSLLDKKKVMGVVLNHLELKTKALLRRSFGTHEYYYNYRYAKLHPQLSRWQKFTALLGSMKMFLRNFRSKKKRY